MAGSTDSYRYSAFGEQIASTGATPNPFGYVGNRAEPAAGLSDFRARAYDPATGRFTSEDPIKGFATMPQTTNPYAYGVNGPLAHTDADGRLAVAIPLLVVVAAPVIVGGAVGCAISEVDCTGAIYDTIAPDPAAAPTPAPTAPGPALAPELGPAPGPALVPEPEPELGPAPGEEVLPSAESGMGADQKIPPASSATINETNGDDGSRALPTFTKSTIDSVVSSSGRYARRGKITEGARAISKRLGDGAVPFRGVARTQGAAEYIIRDILQNPKVVDHLDKYTDVFNAAGRGIRFENGTNRFVTFLDIAKRPGR